MNVSPIAFVLHDFIPLLDLVDARPGREPNLLIVFLVVEETVESIGSPCRIERRGRPARGGAPRDPTFLVTQHPAE